MSLTSRYEIRTVTVFLVAFGASVMMAEYFYIDTTLASIATSLKNIVIVASAFTALLGVINISKYHVNHIQKRTSGRWPFSIWLLLLLYLVIGFGVLGTTSNPQFLWFQEYWMIPVNGASYALTFFYIITGAYRAFKIRNIDSFVLVFSTLLLCLTKAPIGAVLSPTLFPGVGEWIIDNIAGPVSSAFIIGIALGGITIGLRMIIGQERGFFMVGEETEAVEEG